MTAFSIVSRPASGSGGVGTSSTNDYIVRGSGVAETDRINLNAAVAAANAAGKGTIWIDGTVYLVDAINFTAPVSVRGLGPHARMIVQVTPGTIYISYNSSLAINVIEPTAIQGVSTASARSAYITVPGTHDIAKGSTFAIWSHDILTAMASHAPPQLTMPMELHRVKHWDQSTNRLYTEGLVLDRFQYGGHLKFLTLLNNIVIDNLEFVSGLQAPPASGAVMIWAKGCNNLTIENVRMQYSCPGSIWVNMCTNVKIHGIVIEDVQTAEYTYGVVAGCVNGMLLSDSIIYNTRHAFTSTAGDTWFTSETVATGFSASQSTNTFTRAAHGLMDGMLVQLAAGGGSLPSGTVGATNYAVVNADTDTFQLSTTQGGSPLTLLSDGSGDVMSCHVRIGGPINTVIRDCIGYCQYKIDFSPPGTRTMFDTHAEGNGIVFENIDVNVSGSNNYGFGNRARNTTYRNCRVIAGNGPSNATAFYTLGPGTTYFNCEADNTILGIQARRTTGHPEYVDGTRIERCNFVNVRNPIILESGSNHRVIGNTFRSSGHTATPSTPLSASCITIQEGTGHAISGNYLPRESVNQDSMDLSSLGVDDVNIVGNSLTGYTTGLGIHKFIAQNCTVTASPTSTIAFPGAKIANGWTVRVSAYGASPIPTGLAADTTYYVVNHTALTSSPYTQTIQLSLTEGGTPVIISASGVCSLLSDAWQALEDTYAPLNFSDISSAPSGGGSGGAALELPTVIHNGTSTSYSTLALACAALASGDKLVLPPIDLAVSSQISIAVSNVEVTAPYGMPRIYRGTNTTNLATMLTITGNNNVIDGVKFDGVASGTQTSDGVMLYLAGNENVIRNCLGVNAYASNSSNPSAFKVVGNDNVITDCETRDTQAVGTAYAAGIFVSGNRNSIANHRSVNDIMAVRSWGNLEQLTIDGLRVTGTTRSGTSVYITSTNDSSMAGSVLLNRVMIDLDYFSPGSGLGCVYANRFENFNITNSVISHPIPSNEPSITVTAKNTHCENVITSGYVIPNAHFSTFTVDPDTDVFTSGASTIANGMHVQVHNSTLANLPGGLTQRQDYWMVEVSGSTFKLATTPGGSAVDVTSAGTPTHYWYTLTDSFTAEDCTFVDGAASTLYGLYMTSAVMRLVLLSCKVNKFTNTAFRALELPATAKWTVRDCELIANSASTVYLTNVAVWRTGLVEYDNLSYINLLAGTKRYGSGSDWAILGMTAGAANKFAGTGTPPTTTGLSYLPGDEWTRTDATSGNPVVWQNTATGTTPTWVVKSTLA